MSNLKTITNPGGGELQHMADPREVIAQLTEVLGPDGLTQGLLETLKVPSGTSAPAWCIQDLEQGEISVKEVQGVVLATRFVRGYWREKLGSRPSMRPDCKSSNSIIGDGDPGGNCATCPFAKYGSALNEKGEATDGQACKQMMEIWMIRPDMLIPSIVRVPPSSLKNAKHYFLQLTSKGIKPHTALTGFQLERRENKNAVKYMEVVLRFVGRLDQAQANSFEALRQYIQRMVGQTFDLTSDDYVTVDTPADAGAASDKAGPPPAAPPPPPVVDVQPEAAETKASKKRR